MAKQWEPREYQLRACRKIVSEQHAALFLDPGLGKTSIVLAAFKALLKAGLVDRLYVIAPLRVCHLVWPAEARKWLDFNELKVAVLHGPDKDRLLVSDANVYVINPEGLSWFFEKLQNIKKSGHPSSTKFSKEHTQSLTRRAMLVIDESTKFKHTNSLRFKLLKPHLKDFARRYILTGTPISNGLIDLFGQIYIVDEGASLGRYITHYRNTYFDSSGFGGYTYTPKSNAQQQIEALISPFTLRMEADDYLSLPEIVENDVIVDLPPAAMQVYKSMELELATYLFSGEAVTAANAGVATSKCRQIANGGIYTNSLESGNSWEDIHTAKIDAVQSIVEELSGKPVLIAYEYGHDLHRLKKALGERTPHIGGGVSTNRAREIEILWNLGRLPVLLGQPASIGHGLNLQAACQHVIWHSLTWDLELTDQFLRRIRRSGNPHDKIFVHRIIARNTVDAAILRALRRKDKSQRTFLDALKCYLEGNTDEETA